MSLQISIIVALAAILFGGIGLSGYLAHLCAEFSSKTKSTTKSARLALILGVLAAIGGLLLVAFFAGGEVIAIAVIDLLAFGFVMADRFFSAGATRAG